MQRANSSTSRLPTPLDPYDAREAARRSVVSAPGYAYRRRPSVTPEGHERCGLQLQGGEAAQIGEAVEEGSKDPIPSRTHNHSKETVQRPKPARKRNHPRPDAFESGASSEQPMRTKKPPASKPHHPKPPPRAKRPPQYLTLSKKRTIINIPPSKTPRPPRQQPPPTHLKGATPTPGALESQQPPSPPTRLQRLRALAHRVANYIDDDTNELFEPKSKPRVGGPRRRWWKPSKKVIWVLVGTGVLTVGCSVALFPEAFTGKGGSGL